MQNNSLQRHGSGEFSNGRNRHNFVLKISAVVNIILITSLKRASTSEASLEGRIIIFLFEILFFFIFFLIFYLLLSVFRFTLFSELLFVLSYDILRSFLVYRWLTTAFSLINAVPFAVLRLPFFSGRYVLFLSFFIFASLILIMLFFFCSIQFRTKVNREMQDNSTTLMHYFLNDPDTFFLFLLKKGNFR